MRASGSASGSKSCSTWATWLSHDCNLILSSKASRASSEPMRCFSVSSNANKLAVPPQYTPVCARAIGSLLGTRFFGLPLAVKNFTRQARFWSPMARRLSRAAASCLMRDSRRQIALSSSSRAAFASCAKNCACSTINSDSRISPSKALRSTNAPNNSSVLSFVTICRYSLMFASISSR